MTAFARRMTKTRLTSKTTALADALETLATNVRRAQENLKEGGSLDTRMLANAAHIDVLSAEVNLLREMNEILGAESEEKS